MNKAFEKILDRLEEEKEYSYADFDEYVNNYSPCLDSEYDDFFHRGLERAVKVIKEVAKEYNNGWISCSEIDKLPKDGTPVLVQDYEDYYEVYYCETKRGMKGFSDGDWWSSPNNYKAWQPLPEPYQPKGE